jgi:hypothetical protein
LKDVLEHDKANEEEKDLKELLKFFCDIKAV